MTAVLISGGKRRRVCWECGKAHGRRDCPLELREDLWGVMDTPPAKYSKETPGRAFLRAFREEFEKVHGPQKWKVAI